MIHLAGKFAPLGWNSRIFTEDDFARLCRKEKIKVIEIALIVPAFYLTTRGRRCIYLDHRLRGARRLHAAFHELAHYFLHVGAEPNAAFYFMREPRAREELEAETFAAVALIPQCVLREMSPGEIEEAFNYPRELVEFRLKVFELYGL